jgi:enoyl-CoA hydratase
MTYETIETRTEGPDGRKVGIVTLNRPKQLNALNDQLMDELGAALKAFDADDAIGCIVLTGSEKAFAAGADISRHGRLRLRRRLQGRLHHAQLGDDAQHPQAGDRRGQRLRAGRRLRVAMMCDFIIAADNAKFGQPEIKLGIIPGAGGTQRLPRAVGKSKAMDMALTGRMMDAQEAERSGLVSRVVPLDKLMDEALGAALHHLRLPPDQRHGRQGSRQPRVRKRAGDGVMFERRLFHAMFATEDQKEGMDAFVNKRKPVFKHR